MKSAIKRTQFPLILSWACKIQKVQGFSLPQAIVRFDLQKRNSIWANVCGIKDTLKAYYW